MTIKEVEAMLKEGIKIDEVIKVNVGKRVLRAQLASVNLENGRAVLGYTALVDPKIVTPKGKK